VFDVGCNTGYFSIKMKQRDASVVGADCYNEGIEQARFVADVLALRSSINARISINLS
jgi:2-polyprenyl-3-methyl-5-hydroxy-6-metoxy-1,4-benzoquinol methylase